jgi:hypothetical protein
MTSRRYIVLVHFFSGFFATHNERSAPMQDDFSRRTALLGLGLAAGATALGGNAAEAAKASDAWMNRGATTLKALHNALNSAPRRRDFKTVPMILESQDYWDQEALQQLLAYRGSPKQVWDNQNINGPWMNLMRNNLNTQIYSFKHPDFIAVSATHGPAHLSLYDQATWDKYQLTKLAGAAFATNTFIVEQKAGSADPGNYQDPEGAFSPRDNSIPALQRRGAVFLACHNAIWEASDNLIRQGLNPDKLSHEALAAELTNHLIPDVVLTPGAVATLLELQQVGYQYAT